MNQKAKAFHKYLDYLDLKGGVILGLFTLTVISLGCYATLAGRDVPGGLVTAYLGALGVYATSRTVLKIKNGYKAHDS